MDYAEAIQVLSECGAAIAALEIEHDAIDSTLRTLNHAMLAGAPNAATVRIVDIAMEFCVTHFAKEEQFLRDHGSKMVDRHAVAHRCLCERLGAVRANIDGGDSEATLDAVDLLSALHNHIDHYDRPAFAEILENSDGVDDLYRAGEVALLKALEDRDGMRCERSEGESAA